MPEGQADIETCSPAAATRGRAAASHASPVPLPRMRPPEAADDVGLLHAYRAGDIESFERLFQRLRRSLWVLCLRHLHDPDAADDAVQETFLRLLRIAERVEDGFNVSAWVHRVATNICLEELRQRRRVHLMAGNEPAILGIRTHTRADQPEAAHEMAEARRALVRVAFSLPDQQRACFLLREVEGLSYSDIATRLGIGASAVESLLFRARQRFKAEYLRLEGIEPTRCGMTRHLVDAIGRGRLCAPQERLVTRHLAECAACRQRCAPTAGATGRRLAARSC
jgi:RNA polymerase sigma-70 factor, ECF subfamily